MVLVTALPAPSGENPNIVHMKHHLSHDAQQTRFTRPQVAPLAHMRCEEQRDEKSCGSSAGCTWCGAEAPEAPSKCFHSDFADALPKGWSCKLAAVDPMECISLKTEDSCHSDATCSWCTAGAVPSECVPKSIAKNLPAGVFKCDAAAAAAGSEVEGLACLTNQDEASCSSDKCMWCSSKVPDLPSHCSLKNDKIQEYLAASDKYICHK
eukprot:CAMPEP_0114250926 /NCGR_PEP_ID=MMETSP0058-20121206/14973_1 /TAXON_ID=36894 /ORGANISM="Pyramimonas parkeae, CCMP726" /LENGTH=208 /DNA_ID=CAMNT_0001364645 /DNA_START=167 /DNA_END=793 /DNA_ORIENTATION=-